MACSGDWMSGTGRQVKVMVGVDPSERGGIASVIRLYQSGQFLERWSLRFLATQRGGSQLHKMRAAAVATLTVLGLAVRGQLALVHAHSSSRMSFFRKAVILAIARAAGAATVIHLHGGAFDQFMLKANPAVRWWIRRTLERSSTVVVLSEGWRATIQRLAPAARIEVVPNPVEVPAEPVPPGGAARRHVLYLGRSARTKGTYDLVDAVARLAPDFPDLRLTVAGDGDLEDLRRHAEAAGVADRLDIPGWIDAETRRRFIASASVLALPSYHEGLPMAVLEAMAAGLPVVATPVGGIPDAVKDGREGLLVKPGDVPALAGALRRLLTEPGLGERMGRDGRASIQATCSLPVVLERLDGLYRALGLDPA